MSSSSVLLKSRVELASQSNNAPNISNVDSSISGGSAEIPKTRPLLSSNIHVKNRDELTAALNKARGGETIILSDGNYGDLRISKLSFEKTVTIKGGTFSSVALIAVKNVQLDEPTVLFAPTLTSTSQSQAVRISSSQGVSITDAVITGGLSVNGVPRDATVLDETRNVLGLPAGLGVNISFSTGVTVSGSDISLFHKGIVMNNSSGIVISDNKIHDLRTTPISGSVSADLTISGNHTYNSDPWNYGGDGDHGDRIHIWTDKVAITGLVIQNNVLEQGAGSPMLGIYLDDNNKGLGFVNAVISGNRLTDGQGQGVLLENVSGIVENNTLIWSGSGNAFNNTPRFDIKSGSHDLVLSGNSGPISVREGVYNIQVFNHTGTAIVDKDLSAEALDSIVFDFQTVTARNEVTLRSGVRDLIYTGNGDFIGRGNALANRIVGGSGNDALFGNGGADILEGRLGNDSYYVDNVAQRIIDTGGIDSVYASIGWRLQAGLENLIYTGSLGATLEGNQSNNNIVGGSGDDTLIANGGRDSLQGGLGNDIYVLDSNRHTIADLGGLDTVVTRVSLTLPDMIENLTLTGEADVNATGNQLDNVIRGNIGNNVLNGGTGADVMYGGNGNDTYIVDSAGDQCIEFDAASNGGGIDLIRILLSQYEISPNIENLTFIGTGEFRGIGNNLDNVIVGGAGRDFLFGMGGNDTLFGGILDDIFNGGAGRDVLTGGAGSDVFIFAKGEADGDTISDFSGRGAAVGDSLQFVGWGKGSTFTQTATPNVWKITDGVDLSVAYLNIAAPIHATDFSFVG